MQLTFRNRSDSKWLSFLTKFRRLRRRREMFGGNSCPAGQPVTSIAMDLGYDNVGAFIAMFRKVIGVTPGHYSQLRG